MLNIRRVNHFRTQSSVLIGIAEKALQKGSSKAKLRKKGHGYNKSDLGSALEEKKQPDL